MKGDGCRVGTYGFRVWGFEFLVQSFRFRFDRLGFGVQGSGFKI